MLLADLLAEHVRHGQLLAACLVQFGAFETFCSGCGTSGLAKQRALILSICLRTLRNLIGSPHCWSAGRLLGRHLAVLWSRFGCRLLAPHLRRLLSVAGSGGKGATQAAAAFRGDMRTLAWLLHHAAELRPHVRPLCSELVQKVFNAAHTADTYAVVIGAAANANAFEPELGGDILSSMLNAMDAGAKVQIQQELHRGTNSIWIIQEARLFLEGLRLLPQGSSAALAGNNMGMLDAAYDESYDDEEAWGSDWLSWDDGSVTTANDAFLGPLEFTALRTPVLSVDTVDGGQEPTCMVCEAPKLLRCAIDNRLCIDLVCVVSGHTRGPCFERSSIEAWALRSQVCPITGNLLDLSMLVGDSVTNEHAAQWFLTMSAELVSA